MYHNVSKTDLEHIQPTKMFTNLTVAHLPGLKGGFQLREVREPMPCQRIRLKMFWFTDHDAVQLWGVADGCGLASAWMVNNVHSK